MKKIVIKLGCAFLMLMLCLFLTNNIYEKYFYRQDLKESDAEMLLKLDSFQYTSDVLYFAESSNATLADDDTCLLTIAQMIDSLNTEKVVAIDHGAIHAKTYKLLIENINEDAKVKTLIVTLNMRSFGANWIHSKMETALMKANVMYEQIPPIAKRIMLAFNGFDNQNDQMRGHIMEDHWQHDYIHLPDTFPYKNVRAWDDAVGGKNVLNFTLPNGDWDVPSIELSTSYIKTYAFTIDPSSNPRIKDFDEIVEIAKTKKLKLVYNLLAENMEYADSLVGKVLTDVMKENAQMLIKRYTDKGVLVVDNLSAVAGKEFSEKRWTSEHYTQRGRWTIARNVANAISTK
jgi:hypothetical protein